MAFTEYSISIEWPPMAMKKNLLNENNDNSTENYSHKTQLCWYIDLIVSLRKSTQLRNNVQNQSVFFFSFFRSF